MNECLDCGGKCCTGLIVIIEDDEEIFNDDTLTQNQYGLRTMITNKNLKCVALKDGKCSIYDKRPKVCRDFKIGNECCIEFRNGILNGKLCQKCYLSKKK